MEKMKAGLEYSHADASTKGIVIQNGKKFVMK